ncbi:MAG TPA: hypothetical protein VE133_10385, partial [Candidatus Sulfotelmatobacter sp.]|nr:hypothetical protein [Candidatus Sulfotelmatobacter sp.]
MGKFRKKWQRARLVWRADWLKRRRILPEPLFERFGAERQKSLKPGPAAEFPDHQLKKIFIVR